MHLSVGAAADVVTLGFSATNQRVWNMAINSSEDVGVMRWAGDANAALTFTTSSAGPADLTVDYEVESAP